MSSPDIDRLRRLDADGRIVARQLVWQYADREIARIVSSPLARCVETVVPIAQNRGLVVEQYPELEPGAAVEDLLALLEGLPDATLACTHREVLEKLLGWDVTCEKGAAWVLERNGVELVPALYLAPLEAVPPGSRQAVSSR